MQLQIVIRYIYIYRPKILTITHSHGLARVHRPRSAGVISNHPQRIQWNNVIRTEYAALGVIFLKLSIELLAMSY